MITEVINSREDIKVDEEIRVSYDCILKIRLFYTSWNKQYYSIYLLLQKVFIE